MAACQSRGVRAFTAWVSRPETISSDTRTALSPTTADALGVAVTLPEPRMVVTGAAALNDARSAAVTVLRLGHSTLSRVCGHCVIVSRVGTSGAPGAWVWPGGEVSPGSCCSTG